MKKTRRACKIFVEKRRKIVATKVFVCYNGTRKERRETMRAIVMHFDRTVLSRMGVVFPFVTRI